MVNLIKHSIHSSTYEFYKYLSNICHVLVTAKQTNITFLRELICRNVGGSINNKHNKCVNYQYLVCYVICDMDKEGIQKLGGKERLQY